jgi:proteasome assembly chaperone (PAC2) family protein
LKRPYKIHVEPRLESSSLIVGWSEDGGKLGSKVIDYLIRKLGGQEFAQIEPLNFFPLGGVAVQDDVAIFPESKFYFSEKYKLVFFLGSSPVYEWYEFLNTILDVPGSTCGTTELYTVGGMVSLGAHTMPRVLLTAATSAEMKELLQQYGLASDVDYETPSGQRPTLSSFLLWVAKRRNLPGAGLWVPIPFYFLSVEDPRACKAVLEFFNNRFHLGLDFADLDEEIRIQDEKIAQLAVRFPDIASYIWKLERNTGLTEEENRKLITEIEALFRRGD